MKKGYKILLITIICLIALTFSLIQRIDRTPFKKTAHYQEWLAQFSPLALDSNSGPLQIGWAKENMTPTSPTPLSGHGNRWGKHFDAIHDSLYVRTIAIKDQERTIYFVSADMLIIPPNIVKRLESLLKEDDISLSDVHFGATHTHNGRGAWGEKLAGRLFSGKYNADAVESITQKFRLAIINSTKKLRDIDHIQYSQYENSGSVSYRIPAEGGIVDDNIRSLLFVATDSSKAEIVSFAAHATTLGSRFLQISRDYPGPFIDSLEKNDRDFALFYAGAVGSMGPISIGTTPIEHATYLGNELYKKHSEMTENNVPESLLSASITIPMPPPTLRFSKNYALRPWVFHTFFGENHAHIKITKIGNTLLLGIPADFSGEFMDELSSYAQSRGLNLIVTSFNGDYVGYILPKKVYDVDFHETFIMSWNGYETGEYYVEIVRQIIDLVALP